MRIITALVVVVLVTSSASAQEKPVVGFIPKAQKPIALDGKLMFDLPPGVFTLELVATDKAGAVITSRTETVLHGNPASK
jgi:hypothetical protein